MERIIPSPPKLPKIGKKFEIPPLQTLEIFWENPLHFMITHLQKLQNEEIFGGQPSKKLINHTYKSVIYQFHRHAFCLRQIAAKIDYTSTGQNDYIFDVT